MIDYKRDIWGNQTVAWAASAKREKTNRISYLRWIQKRL